MNAKVIVICFCIAVASAYPYEFDEFDGQDEDYAPYVEVSRQRRDVNWAPKEDNEPKIKFTNFEGGGNRKDGVNVHTNTDFKVWESNNGKHQINGQAGYTQHLGGQWGSGRPDYRAGATYTFRG